MSLDVLARSPWLSLLTFLLGLWGGHYFSLFRDRRKEFNDAAKPIRAALLVEHHEPLRLSWPSLSELESFAERLPLWQRRGFREAWGEYDYCIGENHQDAAGQPLLNDPVQASRLAERCLRYCRIR